MTRNEYLAALYRNTTLIDETIENITKVTNEKKMTNFENLQELQRYIPFLNSTRGKVYQPFKGTWWLPDSTELAQVITQITRVFNPFDSSSTDLNTRMAEWGSHFRYLLWTMRQSISDTARPRSSVLTPFSPRYRLL